MSERKTPDIVSGPEGEHPRKRAAFESPTQLAKPLQHDPNMARPLSTVAGSVLVLVRSVIGLVWLGGVVLVLHEIVASGIFDLDDLEVDQETLYVLLVLFLAVVGLAFLADAVFGVLILRGNNVPRMIVMVFSVISITTSFVGWWVNQQEVRLEGTLPSVALDILVLLALSSRSAAAYARRNERSAGEYR